METFLGNTAKVGWMSAISCMFFCLQINSSCDVTTFVENVDGFLNYYSRMTERCEDFICTLALETSCEGSARICRSMNLKTSGDSIIRLLTVYSDH